MLLVSIEGYCSNPGKSLVGAGLCKELGGEMGIFKTCFEDRILG